MSAGNGREGTGDPRGRREGQSIANLWAEMVQAAQEGEVVAVMDKHGHEVAVMIGMDRWDEITKFVEEHT